MQEQIGEAVLPLEVTLLLLEFIDAQDHAQRIAHPFARVFREACG